MVVIDTLTQTLDDSRELFEMGKSEDDDDTILAVQDDLLGAETTLETLEFRRMFSNPMDPNHCFIDIQAGAGGTEAQDWASMLLRMYLRNCERKDFKVEVLEESEGEVAGIKSATFAVHAPFAYGTLSVEQGTHRLVRISPFDNQSRRQTSFAEVEVLPVVETTDHIDIPEDEIRVDVYRSSGPGGQGVNTTDSAVRLTHIPTGIVVSCQNERSQHQNKDRAMQVLKAKLAELERQKREAELDAIRGNQHSVGFGSQIRSYVLQPYQMVKDLRSEHETGNVDAVFDGALDDFMEAYLRAQVGEGVPVAAEDDMEL